MKRTIEIDGCIVWAEPVYKGDCEFRFVNLSVETAKHCGYIPVTPHTFTVEVPDNFDPRPAQLEKLNAKELELKAAFAKAMMELADDRAKLLCIESAA